jgi:lipopolysaccharide transport system permease protein
MDQLTEPSAQRVGAHGAAATSAPIQTIRLAPTHGFSRVLSPRELWRYREVALQLAVRDVTVRYRQTFLGALWAILQPVMTMVVFTLIFGHLAHLPSEGKDYALFSLAGVVPWTFFSNAVSLGSQSLVGNAALVAKTYFPRIFIPAGVLVAGMVDLVISVIVLIVIVVATGNPLSVKLLVLPLLAAIAFIAALGVSSGLAALNVRYRDVRYVVPFAVQLWLFITPIAYPITLVHSPWRTLIAINPMVGVVEGFRWAVLGTTGASWGLIGLSVATAIVLLVAGLAYFDRVEREFADLM